MKVVLLSTSDSSGGAAIACKRLAICLSMAGHEVTMLVMEKKSTENWIEQPSWPRNKIDQTIKDFQYMYSKMMVFKAGFVFSDEPWWGHDLSKHPKLLAADIIQIHWINHGFLSLKNLKSIFKLNKPVIWHMHDFWPFTGGCHYPGTCSRYLKHCGLCPALRVTSAKDASFKQLSEKTELFKINPPTLVGASKWLADRASESKLGKFSSTTHIANPIFANEYFPPKDKGSLKLKNGLNLAKKYILFAAMNVTDSRKGFNELIAALSYLREESYDLELLIAGKTSDNLVNTLPYPSRFLGSLNASGMREAYQMADLFVIPSLEENLPNTILESIACGTPVVGFDIGGIGEMIIDFQNGILAKTISSHGLAKAIITALNTNFDVEKTVSSIERFTPERIGSQYTRLFNSVLNKPNPR
jgi:glycosyltransferase involved in cell wall biosynthesis